MASRSPLSGDEASQDPAGWSLIDMFLREQAPTPGTAVETFSRQHDLDSAAQPAQAKYYRDLIPLSLPRPGEQFAFEVDLDSCSGCKSCVTACHNLNGLEDDELWRSVGLLHGGTTKLPVVQHVTTACHHCVEPACLHGCPVNAYEKDVVTGIVRHLDDQCIGCQYCILKCPYDVPKYSHSKGIVRKCDMCSDRLKVGEAPACVQACPNQAIRITIVNKREVVEECEANLFLPGAPEPGYTLPSTIYKTERALPRNLLPADYYSVTPGHNHAALVNMLVLTQMSVGAFAVEQLLPSLVSSEQAGTFGGLRLAHVAFALALGVIGLAAAVFHLGRPLYAFRAMIGLRTSWLSREILAFGLFAACASGCAALAAAEHWGYEIPTSWSRVAGWGAVLSGLLGIFCSVMIYADTRRPFWNGVRTGVKFFLTAAVLGTSAVLLASLMGAASSGEASVADIMSGHGRGLCLALMAAAGSKLLWETGIFRHLWTKQNTPLKRTALLMTRELSGTTWKRYLLGLAGGVLLPLLLWAEPFLSPRSGFSSGFVIAASALGFGLNLLAEWYERSLFFRAVVAPKMPGAPSA